MARTGERGLSPRPEALAGLAVAVTVMGALGVISPWPGLIHLVALPPLDLVADLRLLLVHAPDLPTFLAGVTTSLVVRSAVLAVLMGGLSRERFLLALRWYLVVLPFATLAAVLLYGAGAVLFYGLFWFGLIATLVLFVLTAPVPWLTDKRAPFRLRSRFAAAARRGFRAGTLGAYLAVLVGIGFVADLTQPLGPVLLVPVSAAATYAAAWVLRTDPGHRAVRRALAALPAAGITALLVIAASGPAGPPLAPAPAQPRPGSIMLMSGVDSASGSGAILEIDPHVLGWTCDRTFYFSYAGPGGGQPRGEALCPIEHGAPYTREDTLRSRAELVPFLQAQTAEMIPPGVVAGHSQGVWLVWQAAADNRIPNVATIVLVGPLPTNPVDYPRLGERAPGAVGRMVLELVAVLPRPGGTTVFDPRSPLGREWLADRDAIATTLDRPLPPDLRALSVPSMFDLPLIPRDHRIDRAADACPVPVIHPNLPYAEEFHQAVRRFVDGHPLPGCPAWREAVGPLLRHFSVQPAALVASPVEQQPHARGVRLVTGVA